ncbi:head completion/stabilization protein [Utexia brackfieldae]|uniref:head completion/stabilization protein n=1 Tax=Utexia brackfieldae TaxID=3074108 RepID=UPI00370DCA0D
MSDFIAISQPKEDEDLEITNISFFPHISVKDVREAQRLDGTVTTVRLKKAIIAAIIAVNDELVTWRFEQQDKGYTSIEQVSDEMINDEYKFVHYYKNAVYCQANALLNDRYLNFDATAKATKQIEPELQSAGDLYRDARYSIRDILGKSHSTMELL